MAQTIVITVLWAIMSLLTMIEYAPYCKDMPEKDRLAVGVIFIIGGPIFAAANVLEAMLDCFMPEGWDEDNGTKGY